MKYAEKLPNGAEVQVQGTGRQVRKAVDVWRVIVSLANQLSAQEETPEPDRQGADSSHMHAGYRGFEERDGLYGGQDVPIVQAKWLPTPTIGFVPNTNEED